MIESVFVIILACLCFFAIFQYANLFASKAVLSHAAARAARARAVGFNHWMVEKSARAAAIPASGKRLTPAAADADPALARIVAFLRANKLSAGWDLALTNSPGTRSSSAANPTFVLKMEGLIRAYLDSVNGPTAENVLDYELWEALSVDVDEPINLDGATPGTLTVTVRQRHPLLIALEPLAEGELRDSQDQKLALEGFFDIESHYPLYMEDLNW